MYSYEFWLWWCLQNKMPIFVSSQNVFPELFRTSSKWQSKGTYWYAHFWQVKSAMHNSLWHACCAALKGENLNSIYFAQIILGEVCRLQGNTSKSTTLAPIIPIQGLDWVRKSFFFCYACLSSMNSLINSLFFMSILKKLKTIICYI